ncbi:dTMP kinase [Pelagibaculum spongiae]|uniref:Thymidylate kinase n=1 Tax=Pelagibaculum spongiae TaxID=2080658 RepID=A0A2V1GTK2_9GAMM|nr:dTMP kinase [Pelagibaculum spongiae]PVZ68938.1 dTMP kinase [Pelagibaculum spongiae]
MSHGKFITFEGIEGVGKTTNIDFAKAWLEDRGITCHLTREPGGTPLAEEIRQLLLVHRDEKVSPLCEMLLFFASRAQHLAERIKPALDRGEWVICSRFTDATMAYQCYGRGMDLQMVQQLAQITHADLMPDTTILLDAPAEVGMQRAWDRGETDRIEQEKIDFFQRVREGYLKMAQQEPNRYQTVNADQPLLDVQIDLAKTLESLIQEHLI